MRQGLISLRDAKQESARQFSSRRRLDLALVFDATGSMNPYIESVRSNLARLSMEIVQEVPDSVFAALVYGDYDAAFLVKKQDLTNNIGAVTSFILNSGSAPNSDWPEAVEVALHEANGLSWRVGSQRALVLVGDAPPHGVVDSRRGELFYRDAAAQLGAKGVHVYAVQCGEEEHTRTAFNEIASLTGGKYLRLSDAGDLCHLIVAICMKEVGLLAKYAARVQADHELTESRASLIRQLTDGKEP